MLPNCWVISKPHLFACNQRLRSPPGSQAPCQAAEFLTLPVWLLLSQQVPPTTATYFPVTPPAGATYYFDYFAHRYAASVGLARRRTGSAAATPRSAAATPAVSEALSGGGAGSGAGSGKKQR